MNEKLTDPDVVPDLPSNPVSRPGGLWVLGSHRLICGDSTLGRDTARLLGQVKPHLMVTDPPYGVSYDPAWRKRAGVTLNDKKLGAKAGRVHAASHRPAATLQAWEHSIYSVVIF